MSIRVQPLIEDRLELSRGDYLIVTRELNAGAFRRLPDDAGPALVLAYLRDWSFQDPGGNTLPIRGQEAAQVVAALDSLDRASYREVLKAIQAHHKAREKADATV